MDEENLVREASDTLAAAAGAAWGETETFGGNCGQFALAACSRLEDAGFSPTLCFVLRDDDGIGDAEELLDVETDVQHVAVEAAGLLFDGSGKVTEDGLVAFALEFHGDRDPGILGNVPFEVCGVAGRIVRTDTDLDKGIWTSSWPCSPPCRRCRRHT